MTDFRSLLTRDIAARRISIELVLEAYNVSGIEPRREEYYDKDANCGCPIGAIYVCDCPKVNSTDRIDFWAEQRWGETYVMDFTSGFDDEPDKHGERVGCPEGYADGRAAALAVFEEAAA